MAGFNEILKHGRNYLVANLATRALAFISIPVYTRLLSPNDYGIVSVYLSVVAILASMMSFSADRSVSRYYFDQKSPEDFKRFVGTSSLLALAFFLFNSSLLLIFAEKFGHLVGLSKSLIYLIIPISFINVIGLTFDQIFGPLKRSKNIAISSLSKVYLGFSFSILLILLFKSDKYYGQILGQIFAGTLLMIYWIKSIKPYFKFSFDKSYIRYIFTYSIPLIPYALSGVIIEQFGKIAIGHTQNVSHAGYYSIALAISGLVSVVIAVTHQAWNPYYFEYMNSGNYVQIDKDYSKIFRITLFVAIGISAFGKEIGLLLTKREFSGSLYLIPIFTVGYIFYQLSYAYMRNFGYSRKTYFMTITVLVSGLSNILLNLLLMKHLGELGAAISFVSSYILMAFLAWFLNKFFIKLHATPLKLMLVPLLITIPFYASFYFLTSVESLLLSLFLKLILTILFAGILFWYDRNEIFHYIKRIFIH